MPGLRGEAGHLVERADSTVRPPLEPWLGYGVWMLGQG